MNQETVTYHLKNSENILAQPYYLNPQEFSKLYLQHTYLGVNTQILKLLEYYFSINIQHPELIKYLYTIDQIFNSSQQIQEMPIRLGNLFVQCYHQYFIRGQKNKLQELKIIRKMWYLYVDEKELTYMRTQLFKLTKHDIDIFLKESSKQFLIQHFTHKNIHQHHINRILMPTALPTNIYDHKKESFQNTKYNGGPSKRVKRDAQSLKENSRGCSVSTSASIDRRNDLPPTMMNEEHENCLLILNKLRHQTLFECIECGKRFSLKKNLEQHKNNHFTQKLKNFRIQRIKKQVKLRKVIMGHKNEKTISEWTSQNQKIIPQHDLYINQENLEDKKCLFCGEEFHKLFLRQRQSWVVKNAIQVELENMQEKEEKGLMHVQCYGTIYE